MSQEFQQHWLSAYLDNELSSDERALVERRLGEDAETQQLLDDLKRVRGLVATLPAWPDSSFQFDMSRLSAVELADDLDFDELDAGQTHLAINQSRPQDASRVVDTAAVNESAMESKKQSTGMSTAAWRGVLSLAAGLLLLILCVPLFLQREAGIVAFGTRPVAPESNVAPGGGKMGGTSSVTDPDAASDMSTSAAKNLADAPVPAPFNAPVDPGAFGGGRGASAPSAPSPTPAAVSNAAGDTGAASGLGGARSARSAPANAEKAELSVESLGGQAPGPARGGFAPGPMQPKRAAEPPLELTLGESQPPVVALDSASLFSQSFVCAKSDAWSEAEVKQTLPQVLTYVSENRSLVELKAEAKQKANPKDEDSATSKPADARIENNFAKVPGAIEKNDLMLNELPKTADVNSWFTQIQTAQPLTQLQLTPDMRVKDRYVQGADKLAEEAQSRLGGSLVPAAPSPALKADTSAVAPRSETAGKSSEFGAGQAKTQATSQGRIILFVTEAEATKILSSLFPSKTNGPPEQNSDEKKVIVILNR